MGAAHVAERSGGTSFFIPTTVVPSSSSSVSSGQPTDAGASSVSENVELIATSCETDNDRTRGSAATAAPGTAGGESHRELVSPGWTGQPTPAGGRRWPLARVTSSPTRPSSPATTPRSVSSSGGIAWVARISSSASATTCGLPMRRGSSAASDPSWTFSAIARSIRSRRPGCGQRTSSPRSRAAANVLASTRSSQNRALYASPSASGRSAST